MSAVRKPAKPKAAHITLVEPLRSNRPYVPDPLMAAADLIHTWLLQSRPSDEAGCDRTAEFLAQHVRARKAELARPKPFVVNLIETRARQCGMAKHDPAAFQELQVFLDALEEHLEAS